MKRKTYGFALYIFCRDLWTSMAQMKNGQLESLKVQLGTVPYDIIIQKRTKGSKS